MYMETDMTRTMRRYHLLSRPIHTLKFSLFMYPVSSRRAKPLPASPLLQLERPRHAPGARREETGYVVSLLILSGPVRWLQATLLLIFMYLQVSVYVIGYGSGDIENMLASVKII
jgi:hypothetical protein